jgi:hypothetical protein
LNLLRETVRHGGERAGQFVFSATWIARESGTAVQDARAILSDLSSSERYTHPWLQAFVRIRCPRDDRDLGLIEVGNPVPDIAECPEDGEVELDPDRNQLVFKPTNDLLADAEKKTAV